MFFHSKMIYIFTIFDRFEYFYLIIKENLELLLKQIIQTI